MKKVNCWEFKQCGREPGGNKAAELGTCPAALQEQTEGINGGMKGGRACWAIAGTLCGGKVQGTFAAKLSNCLACEFYRLVLTEEGKTFVHSKVILALLTRRESE